MSTRVQVFCDIAVFGVALFLRYFLFLTGRSPFSVDAEDYVEAAVELYNFGRISDPDVMPGYPVLRLLFGEGVLHLDIFLSAATAVLAAMLARQIGFNRFAGLVVGLGVACHPNLAAWAGSGLTEPSVTFLFALGLLLCYRGNLSLGTTILAVSVLFRPTFVLVVPLLFILFSQAIHRERLGRFARHCAVILVISTAIFAPWWIHNYERYGTFVPLNLGGGHVLYVGNNPDAKTGSGLGGIDILADHPYAQVTPITEKRRQMRDAAIEWILANPGKFLELSVLRFGKFWHIEEHSNATVWLLIQPYHLLFFAFLILGWKHRFVAAAPLVLSIAYLCAIHTILISLPRYQFPVTPLIIVLGIGWAAQVVSNHFAPTKRRDA